VDKEVSFSGQPFLEKEAAPNPRALVQGVKNVWQNFRRTNPPIPTGPTPPAPAMPKFILKPGDAAVDPSDIKALDRQEVIDKVKERMKGEGTGSFVTDGILGLTKKIAPKSKEPIENAIVNAKGTLEYLDTKAGAALAGNKPNSIRGKLFSSKQQTQVAETKDGEALLREYRKPSMVAPIENAAKIAAPFLATAYVAEKMYPKENELGKNVNVPTYESNFQKQSFEIEDEEIFDKSLVEDMDKVASLQKIAQLEDDLTKVAIELEEAQMEKVAMAKRLEETVKEKDFFEKQASTIKNNLLEKQAAFEELRLRTIAQKRSKIAVDLSEEMLECGLIKQADFQSTIDDLMEADPKTIKVYQNLVKEAKSEEESLESLAILREYKGNDKLATPSKELAPQGLSKRGQSIGEAARDLIK
jgi:hypothetical protein